MKDLETDNDILKNTLAIFTNQREKMEEEQVLKRPSKLPLKKLKGSILHTDRGSQYTAKNYRKKLSEGGINPIHNMEIHMIMHA